MSGPLFGVYGASGCGRGIMPLARDYIQRHGIRDAQLVFIDDNPAASIVNGQPVVTYREFTEMKAESRTVALAVANSALRAALAQRCSADGILPWALIAHNAVIMDDVTLAEGALLSPFVTLTSNIQIGKFFHANLYSYVEHDCVIGDFVTFAPGAKCNGNIHIHDHAYIGSGAVIRQGLPNRPLVIGRGAVVGMGAVVTRDVPAGATVVGNPAAILKKG